MTAYDNAGVAFALTVGAGASTAIGALIIFFPSLINVYASAKFLAGGLGLSAGVMLYVSIEIFTKSMMAFEDADLLPSQAYTATTISFFAGILLMVCLNHFVHILAEFGERLKKSDYLGGSSDKTLSESNGRDFKRKETTSTKAMECDEEQGRQTVAEESDSSHHGVTTLGVCCHADPTVHMDNMREMAQDLQEKQEQERIENDSKKSEKKKRKNKKEDSEKEDEDPSESRNSLMEKERQKLMKMGANTAVAIALHNFPEGLATFVAALHNPSVGAVMAAAIAIHNIPEGMCVALPIYYATGNRFKAFCWACLSGASEPFAALLGWLVLASIMNDLVYGLLFGMVCGMMVMISLKELLPTAHRYDPDDKVVTAGVIVGMAVMAVSLVLFATVA